MEDPLIQYSKPLKTEKTKLAVKFWNNPRDSKKGRKFIPLFDVRFPLVKDFKLEYIYCSKILEKNNISGNHYHRIKQEILIPLNGEFTVELVNAKTKEKETLSLRSEDNVSLYVTTGIAHKITSQKDNGVLLVLASTPSATDDEVEYNV